MSVDKFKAVKWQSGDRISENKLNRMADNEVYLRDHMPRTVYRAQGVRLNEGIKIVSGIALIPGTKKNWATKRVEFGNSLFARNCTPIVTTGIYSLGQSRIQVVLHGRGRMFPDSRGFVLSATSHATDKKHRRLKKFFVAWSATGY